MIVEINETQFNWLFNEGINENLHYPQFLEDFADYVFNKLYNEIHRMLKKNILQNTVDVSLNNKFDYTDNIICVITLVQNNSIDNFELYGAKYYSENFANNKIIKPILYIQIPFNENKKFMTTFLKSVIFHELTHLYDDWIRQKNNTDDTSLSLNNNIKNTMAVFNNFVINDSLNPLNTAIAKIAYLGIDSEQKAFSAQIVSELKRVNCTLYNFREKYKETISYKNFIKIKNELLNVINNASTNDLWFFNIDIFDNYKKSLLPKLDYNEENIDMEKYRKMLLKWADNIFHQFMLKFGGVLTYYLDELKKERSYKGII